MPDDKPESLQQQQAALVEDYLDLRQQAESDSKAKRKLSRLEGKLDGLYWKQVEKIIIGRVSPDRQTLDFSESERLTIDMGLLDIRLVENASPTLLKTLSEELFNPGAPNHFYLTEWLENRYRDYRLTEAMGARSKRVSENALANSPMGAAWRNAIEEIKPLFNGLPGVNPDIAKQVYAGELDNQILRTSFTLLHTPQRKIFLYRHSLRRLRGYVFDRARARSQSTAARQSFEKLNEIYAAEWQKRYHEYEQNVQTAGEIGSEDAAADMVTLDKASEYLRKELLFIRSLLPIGGVAGGVTRTCAVLLRDCPRVTKKDTAAGFSLAQTCDREYTVNPVVLIAPFRGRGIFEWDRDSLVVSLVPVDTAADSVANAAGNFRMLTDSLQKAGGLRSEYTRRFPEEKFQKAFQADYRAWVNGVGRGDKSALPETKFDFFRTHLGPDCSTVLAPRDLKNLGSHTLASIRKRLGKQVEAGTADATMYHRLAVLAWQDDDLAQARTLMAKAVQINPDSGEWLFSLALILSRQGNTQLARKLFAGCRQKMPQTLWAVYAQEALEERLC